GGPLKRPPDRAPPVGPGVGEHEVDPPPPQPHPLVGGTRPATAQPGEGVPARQAGLRAGGDETAADELDGQAEVVRQPPRGADQGRLPLDAPGLQAERPRPAADPPPAAAPPAEHPAPPPPPPPH